MMLNNRPSRNLPLLVTYLSITVFFIGALLISIWFSRSSYTSLINYVTAKLNRPDLVGLITNSLFTKENYDGIYRLHWIIYPLITALAITLYYHAFLISKFLRLGALYLRSVLLHIKIFFKNLTTKEKLVLTSISFLYVVLVLYNDHLKEISYDEAWGYNYYINKPFYFPLILFNTYPLFNLIAHVFTFLPFEQVINIRLPALLFGLLSLLALFYTLRRKVGFFLTIVALFALVGSPLFFIYSSLSRGITLSLFFAIIVFHLVSNVAESNTFSSRFRSLFVFFNILGIISMPTFIVYTFCNSLFLIHRKRKEKRIFSHVFVAFSIICAAAFIFYLPVILNSGPTLVANNIQDGFTVTDTFKKLLSFFYGLSALFFVSKYACIAILVISIVLMFATSITAKKTMAVYCIFIILSTVITRAITGNIFPERSLNYLILCFIYIFVWLISLLTFRFSRWAIPLIGIAVTALFCLAFIHNEKELFRPVEDKDAKTIAVVLLQNDVKTAYLEEEEFWFRVPMIEYYYSTKGKHINFSTSEKKSSRYKPFSNVDDYDCIVTTPTNVINNAFNFKVIFKNNSFVLLKKI